MVKVLRGERRERNRLVVSAAIEYRPIFVRSVGERRIIIFGESSFRSRLEKLSMHLHFIANANPGTVSNFSSLLTSYRLQTPTITLPLRPPSLSHPESRKCQRKIEKKRSGNRENGKGTKIRNLHRMIFLSLSRSFTAANPR